MINPKTPPHNLEAEQSVLGAILLEESNIARAEEILSPEDFYSTANARIFETMLALHDERKPIDSVTLVNLLKNRGILEEVGGPGYIANLVAQVPVYTNYEEYCKIVQEKSVIRELIKTATDILNESYGQYDDVEAVIEGAEQGIYRVSQGKKRGNFVSIADTLGETMTQIELIEKNKGQLTGLNTGFEELNHYTSGLQRSDLIFVAARPSMGKTAFALNLAQNAALKENASVAIFSLEMSRAQLVQRMLCAEAMVDSNKIRKGELTAEDWDSISLGYTRLFNTGIYIDDTPGVTLSEVRSKCRRMKSERGLDLILIDYLQLMTGRGKAENRQNEISEISRGLKGLAREMDCPLICLSQLSRAPDARPDHHPVLADLRESGSIEQDADVVMFLYRDYYYNKEAEPHIAELDIAKQRNGPTGRLKLAWLPEYTKFNDPAPDYYDEAAY
ncbi:MAG: replicative DNA helicase [Eubacterium sp.]|nr:replicative DNA helicase [Eubacterium sp.]